MKTSVGNLMGVFAINNQAAISPLSKLSQSARQLKQGGVASLAIPIPGTWEYWFWYCNCLRNLGKCITCFMHSYSSPMLPFWTFSVWFSVSYNHFRLWYGRKHERGMVLGYIYTPQNDHLCTGTVQCLIKSIRTSALYSFIKQDWGVTPALQEPIFH